MTEHEAMPDEHPAGSAGVPARGGRRTGGGTGRGGPVALLAGGLLLAAALSGCGGGGGGATASAPRTLPGSAAPASGDPASGDPAAGGPASGDPAGSEPPAPTAPAGGSTGPAPTAHRPSDTVSTPPPAAGRCHTSDLRASIGRDDPGAGQENFAVVLTNRSGRTCTVHGFPGVAFVNAAGEQVTVDPERATGQPARRVVLAPGAAAWSAMSFSNPAVTGVTTVTPAAVLVTPPDETSSLRVPWTGGKVSNTGKASVPRLSPFQSGTGPA
ncbi:DUF4232 domain-containing protein [Streptomyces sp. ME01-24h]|nr:DUF4232 domain-containing protein [Streptomyces sp. ME19-03-3]MDX3356734.1 DUF4232 domain-containing protein [Streptomyces sp. ME01-24h]